MLDVMCCVADDDGGDDDDDVGDKKDAIQCLHMHTPTARALAPHRPGSS